MGIPFNSHYGLLFRGQIGMTSTGLEFVFDSGPICSIRATNSGHWGIQTCLMHASVQYTVYFSLQLSNNFIYSIFENDWIKMKNELFEEKKIKSFSDVYVVGSGRVGRHVLQMIRIIWIWEFLGFHLDSDRSYRWNFLNFEFNRSYFDMNST